MADPIAHREAHPEFSKLIDRIAAQNPLQRKRIEAFVGKQDRAFWAYAEALIHSLNGSFLHDDHDRAEAARSYDRMCRDFLREQIRFRKTGVYQLNDARAAFAGVYSQPDVMRYYMVGLLLSYLLWPNHYAMLQFLIRHLDQISISRYLEIAPGHGLFTVEALRRCPGLAATLVDISETSIGVTTEILKTFGVDSSGVRFVRGDFLTVPLTDTGFDLITMGEVLEHVNDAPGFLQRARQLLAPKGTVFMTTCANCPAIDHIYHFHSADEIRSLIRASGLAIIEDLALPAEDVPESRWKDELITINYAAILAHQ